MDANEIIQHLVDISTGKCTITEESILNLKNAEDQSIALGLLTLFDEVEFKKKKLEDANREKEILLQEIHHRVKNNLQIVSSIFNLEQSNIKDDQAKKMLSNCRSRVDTMALIHGKLYSTRYFGSVDYNSYLTELIEHLKFIHSKHLGDLQVTLDIPPLKLNLDVAIPLGLLINEILTNSMKYGVNPKGKSVIYLKMTLLKPNEIELLLGDNGPGFSEQNFDKNNDTLGMQLIHDLTDQLNGKIVKIDSEKGKGVHYRIHFLDFPLEE